MNAVLRRAVRVALVLLTAYAGLVAYVGATQRRLIYFPGRPPADAVERRVSEAGFLPWTNAAGMRIGWWRPHPADPGRTRVLITHGNAGSADARDYLADALQEGWEADVHVLEYPGYGDRPGEPRQDTLVAAAVEGVDLLAGTLPLYLVGESLGSGVAAGAAAARPDRVAGLLLLTPFDSLANAAAFHYPWLPVGWILRDRYPAAEWLRGYPGPVGVLVGASDTVVPAGLGRRLHDALQGPRRLWDLPGQDHDDAVQQPPEWWREAAAFLSDPIPSRR